MYISAACGRCPPCGNGRDLQNDRTIGYVEGQVPIPYSKGFKSKGFKSPAKEALPMHERTDPMPRYKPCGNGRDLYMMDQNDPTLKLPYSKSRISLEKPGPKYYTAPMGTKVDAFGKVYPCGDGRDLHIGRSINSGDAIMPYTAKSPNTAKPAPKLHQNTCGPMSYLQNPRTAPPQQYHPDGTGRDFCYQYKSAKETAVGMRNWERPEIKTVFMGSSPPVQLKQKEQQLRATLTRQQNSTTGRLAQPVAKKEKYTKKLANWQKPIEKVWLDDWRPDELELLEGQN
jgi:hypothetical protein